MAAPGSAPFTAFIVEAVRTPTGKRNGKLSGWHPADLGAFAVDELVKRSGVKPDAVDDVIFGCVSQVGAQSANLARNVVLSSKTLPQTVPGTSVDRQCGSSQQAVHFAAQAVMSGTQDLVIAGGVESMSTVPIGASVADGLMNNHGMPMSDGMRAKYEKSLEEQHGKLGFDTSYFSQFAGAELLAQKYSLSRVDMEAFAVASHKNASEASTSGRINKHLVPVPCRKVGEELSADLLTADEGIRPQTTAASLAKLKALQDGGVITAGLASQIADGAAAILVCNERALKAHGLKPLARIVSLGLAGEDPVVMLEGPIPATKAALKRANLQASDIDLAEVNEAFASVPLSWAKALNFPLDRLNVNGGAMANGHPLGGTGAKLLSGLVYELQRTQKRFGLMAICEGGGTANALIVENLQLGGAKL